MAEHPSMRTDVSADRTGERPDDFDDELKSAMGALFGLSRDEPDGEPTAEATEAAQTTGATAPEAEHHAGPPIAERPRGEGEVARRGNGDGNGHRRSDERGQWTPAPAPSDLRPELVLPPSHPLAGRRSVDLRAKADAGFWAPDPLDEPDPSTVAMQEAGFASPLHTALGELRRLTPENDEAVSQPVVDDSAQAASAHLGPGSRSARERSYRRRRVAWVEWWSTRGREVLPAIVVGVVIVLAFAVVLASGSKDKARKAGTRPADVGRSTLVPTTAFSDTVPPDTAATNEPPAGDGTSGPAVTDGSGATSSEGSNGVSRATSVPATAARPARGTRTPAPAATAAPSPPATSRSRTRPSATSPPTNQGPTPTSPSTTSGPRVTQPPPNTNPCAGLSGDQRTRCEAAFNHSPTP